MESQPDNLGSTGYSSRTHQLAQVRITRNKPSPGRLAAPGGSDRGQAFAVTGTGWAAKNLVMAIAASSGFSICNR